MNSPARRTPLLLAAAVVVTTLAAGGAPQNGSAPRQATDGVIPRFVREANPIALTGPARIVEVAIPEGPAPWASHSLTIAIGTRLVGKQ
jgi:hypothetical protein